MDATRAPTSWRDHIQQELGATQDRLVLAADPDALLLEHGMLQRIDRLGFDLITFDDHVAFRFLYESRHRLSTEGGRIAARRILVRAAAANLDGLPYDLLEAGHRLSFGLGRLFPKLSRAVVKTLDQADLDALFAAHSASPPPSRLNARDTRKYVLLHAFKIAPETIASEEDLLRFLLRRHYRQLRIPEALNDHIVKPLAERARFRKWPLDRIVADRDAFFAFLQERWPAFLDRMTAADSVREILPTPYEMQVPGPASIAFDHDDVRIYIDSLFREGILKPVPHPESKRLSGSWIMVGVSTDPAADLARRIQGLLQSLEEKVPGQNAGHREWLGCARRWAELLVLEGDLDGDGKDSPTTARLSHLRERIDQSFASWLSAHYANLYNLPPVPPVMLHHVPRLLARHASESPSGKVALLLMDGLALDQWTVARNALVKQRPQLRFRESAVFAWIPTLTSVSRQACFAGRAPLYFPSSISRTDREPDAWRRLWQDEGMDPSAVRFEKKLRHDGDLDRAAAAAGPGVRALGLVVDVVDKIMHGMVLGGRGMRTQVGDWIGEGMLARLLDMLLERGFSVFLTSDHGNVETRGCGRPSEGVLVDTRGKRARIYGDRALRKRVREKFPDTVPWPSIGLPDGYHPLLAPGRRSFVAEGERPVAHGGASMEEVVVPLVEIEEAT